jgi:hypothetical protein
VKAGGKGQGTLNEEERLGRAGPQMSVVRQVVRFYSHVICPLCETKRRGPQAAALGLGLVLAFVLVERTEAVVGAVEK